jgi:LuxR family maltose regulon positive regulatory protein
MTTPLLTTKLYIPPIRPEMVPRPHLIEQLSTGLRSGRKLTLISAPAGFGKTTLLSEWAADCKRPEPEVRFAWVSLDQGDNDLARFWAYFIAALQRIHVGIGEAALAMLRSPKPPPAEAFLTGLINEITAAGLEPFALVLDDYHLIKTQPIHEAFCSITCRHRCTWSSPPAPTRPCLSHGCAVADNLPSYA